MDSLNFIWDNRGQFLDGFGTTVSLALICYACALALGSVVAVMRVSPAAPARAAGMAYVEWFRNVPLLVLLVVAFVCLPRLGLRTSTYKEALIVLSMYTAAQVCEALRSGINAVDRGQAEAARSIGLTFGQNLRHIVLPQAARTVVPPLGNIFIALVKNTALVSVIGVGDLAFQITDLGRNNARFGLTLLVATAVAYLVLTLPTGYLVSRFERRVAIVR